MCPYRLPIGTSPTPLRKLSKGPTVLAHHVENPPESGARKAEKCKKKTGKKCCAVFFLCFMYLHAISSTPMHSPSDLMRNRKNHVKVAGLSSIPFGWPYNQHISLVSEVEGQEGEHLKRPGYSKRAGLPLVCVSALTAHAQVSASRKQVHASATSRKQMTPRASGTSETQVDRKRTDWDDSEDSASRIEVATKRFFQRP